MKFIKCLTKGLTDKQLNGYSYSITTMVHINLTSGFQCMELFILQHSEKTSTLCLQGPVQPARKKKGTENWELNLKDMERNGRVAYVNLS